MELHRETVNNEGVELNCYRAGEGPNMVLLHGHPDCGYGWIRQIERFCSDYHVIAPDLRGCGYSAKSPAVSDYEIEKLVLDLYAVTERFSAEPIVFIGHDWGGIIGWYFAAYFPNIVERLVTICAPHPAEYVRALGDPRQQQATRYIGRILKLGKFDVGFETFEARFPDEPYKSAFLGALAETDYHAVARYYQAAHRESRKFRLRGIPKVRAPTLSIYTSDDPVIYRGAFRNTAGWVDNDVETIVLPLETHFPHQERADTVNLAISDWLGGL